MIIGFWGGHLRRVVPATMTDFPRAADIVGVVSQTMKPATAASKLGIYLPAAPAGFQSSPITRDELDALRADPPEWLAELRRNGPFPRDVVAAKLGVSRSGLVRGGVGDALNAEQVGALIADPPGWLLHERDSYREVVAERKRVKNEQRDS